MTNKLTTKEKLFVLLLAIAFLFIGSAFVWWLWITVMPYFFPSLPTQFTQPGYGPFLGLALLVNVVLTMIKRTVK